MQNVLSLERESIVSFVHDNCKILLNNNLCVKFSCFQYFILNWHIISKDKLRRISESTAFCISFPIDPTQAI